MNVGKLATKPDEAFSRACSKDHAKLSPNPTSELAADGGDRGWKEVQW